MKWVVLLMGFTERLAAPTGMEQIWREVRAEADQDTVIVTPFEWWEDTRGMIDFIRRNSDTPPELMVIAYSWGCGWAFTHLAEDAWRAGVPIRYAVLCDPVYRSRLMPSWLPFNPISISPVFRPPITIPPSVERVEWVRQRKDLRVRGHDLIEADRNKTVIGKGRYLEYNHTQIDESPEFRALATHWVRVFVHGLDPNEAPLTLGMPEIDHLVGEEAP